MSTSRAPAHQNTFAFRHNPNSKKTKIILSLPNEGLCSKCVRNQAVKFYFVARNYRMEKEISKI